MTTSIRDARLFVDGVTKYLRGKGTDGTIIPRVTAALHRISSAAKREKTAVVESVVSLTTTEKADVVRFLSRLLTHAVTLECRINKEHIGGLRIEVGDWVVDTTVRSHIETMKEQLLS